MSCEDALFYVYEVLQTLSPLRYFKVCDTRYAVNDVNFKLLRCTRKNTYMSETVRMKVALEYLKYVGVDFP